jgi:hypothetical protein
MKKKENKKSKTIIWGEITENGKRKKRRCKDINEKRV